MLPKCIFLLFSSYGNELLRESRFYDLKIKCHTWPLDGAAEGLLVFEVSKTNLLYKSYVLSLFLLLYFMYYLISEAVPFAYFIRIKNVLENVFFISKQIKFRLT